jgi:hypothetical protein
MPSAECNDQTNRTVARGCRYDGLARRRSRLLTVGGGTTGDEVRVRRDEFERGGDPTAPKS